MQDPLLKALLINAPVGRVFDRPMSKDARRLLEGMVSWGISKSSNLFKVPQPSIACISAFAAAYKPIKFEEACHNFDMKGYVSLISKAYSPNKAENLLNVMLLKNLDDESWVQNNNLKANTNRVGVMSNDRVSELYEWLTTYYMMTDFNSFDLNKIVELSGEEFNIQTIKQEANKITDTAQRNISYLYAIIRDVTSRAEVVRSREKDMSAHYEERLKIIFAYTGPKVQHNNPDKSAEWRREREWLDALADMDKNGN